MRIWRRPCSARAWWITWSSQWKARSFGSRSLEPWSRESSRISKLLSAGMMLGRAVIPPLHPGSHAVQPLTDRAVVSKLAQTKVAILGAGRGGTALLDLLHFIPSIEIIGISDRDPAAPGLTRAKNLRIPVAHRVEDLVYNHGVNLIMDVTGDPEVERFVQIHKRPETEVLSGSTARLLWELVRHEANLQTELLHAEKLAGIGSFAAGVAHDINNPLQLIMGLAENLAEERDLAAVHEQARDIIEAVKRTSAICRDLTRCSRRASPHEDVPVSVNGKLDEALRIARYASSFHDIEMIKHYQPGVAVLGNPDELLHVFVNL